MSYRVVQVPGGQLVSCVAACHRTHVGMILTRKGSHLRRRTTNDMPSLRAVCVVCSGVSFSLISACKQSILGRVPGNVCLLQVGPMEAGACVTAARAAGGGRRSVRRWHGRGAESTGFFWRRRALHAGVKEFGCLNSSQTKSARCGQQRIRLHEGKRFGRRRRRGKPKKAGSRLRQRQ